MRTPLNIAVTGASGFLGHHLIGLLLSEGHKVTALALDATTAISLSGFDIPKYDVDLRDKERHRQLFQGQDIVYHLAAKIAIRNDCCDELMSVNVEGLKSVAGAALETGVKRFIYISSVHALARYPVHETVDESRPLAVDDPFAYDRSKAFAELALREFTAKGLNTLSINLTGLWGPSDFEPSIMGQTLIKMLTAKWAVMTTEGGFNFVDVRDVATTLVNLIEKGRAGESYILGGEWYNCRELAQTAAMASGKHPRVIILPLFLAKLSMPLNRLIWKMMGRKELYTEQSLVHLVSHRFVSDRKARLELGHKSRPILETFQDMAAWIKSTESKECTEIVISQSNDQTHAEELQSR